MDKLALMHSLDLPTKAIHLLIGGIASHSLRGTASALRVDSINDFLEGIHRIISVITDIDRRFNNGGKAEKGKDIQCKGCGKKSHSTKQCRANEVTCFLCNAKGHYKFDCPKKSRRQPAAATQSSIATSVSTMARGSPSVALVSHNFPKSISRRFISKGKCFGLFFVRITRYR